MLVAKFWLAMRGHSGVGQRVVTGGQAVMRQEIWIRVQAPEDGGEREAQRRVKQLTTAVERLMLTVIEVRSVQISKVADQEN
jgi:hypothetical protein